MSRERYLVLRNLFLAFGMAIIHYFLQRDIRFDWADEGYLWYGVLRTRLGEMPLLDFQSYDPGRYYWCVLGSWLFGPGIFALRLSAALFQGLCLWGGLQILSRITKNFWVSAGLLILSTTWMFWSFRYFDSGIPILAVLFAVRFLEKPDKRRHFEMGVAAGLISCFGLNHGLHVGLAFYLLSLYGDAKKLYSDGARSRLLLILGCLVGFSPILGMGLVNKEFGMMLAERIQYSFLRLAIGMTDVTKSHNGLVFGSLQTASFVFYYVIFLILGGFVLKMRSESVRKNAVLIGAWFVGILYAYQTWTRGTLTHLGEGMFPVIAACVSILFLSKNHRSRFVAWPLICLIVFFSLFVAVPLTNLYYKFRVPQNYLVPFQIGSDTVRIPSAQAETIRRFKEIVAVAVPESETLLLAPVLPGFYCLMNKPSPVWELYFYLPQLESLQKMMIRQMEDGRVRWAILGDVALDGRVERRLMNTHPLLWDYLMAHFESIPTQGLPDGYRLMRRKDPLS